MKLSSRRQPNKGMKNDHLFAKRLSRRDLIVSAGSAASGGGLAATSGDSRCFGSAGNRAKQAVLWTLRVPGGFPPRQLGGGKETDSRTNPLDNTTNPALFAEPHVFPVKPDEALSLLE